MTCPLCLTEEPETAVRGADRRRYYLCSACRLIFVDPAQHLSPEAERARYEQHRNSPEDAGYVRFLTRAIEPALPFLAPGMRGLDYGSGPGPTLSLLLRQRGLACEDYDPFFADHPLAPPYDFVFSTECFEHFRRPEAEIERVVSLIPPGGLLAIMTERWTTLEAFARWHYTRDSTHVSFYHAETLDFLCRRFGLALLGKDETHVALFRRGPAAPAAPAVP